MDLGKYISCLLPMEMELPAIPNPLSISPMYTTIAIVLMFVIVPPLVAFWNWVKHGGWNPKNSDDNKFHFFMFPIDNDKKTPFVIRLGTTWLKSQLLGEWKQEKTKAANISKILKQKTRQLLTKELISQDKCRIFNCSLRSLKGKSKQMVVMGCVQHIKGPLAGDVFMKQAVPKGSSSQERIRACSNETQESLEMISEPAKYSKYQYCFMCSRKNVIPHDSAHFFIDDIFSNKPNTTLQNSRISVCIPICSKECLKISMQALFETKHKKHITTKEEEEEEEEEEEAEKKEEDT